MQRWIVALVLMLTMAPLPILVQDGDPTATAEPGSPLDARLGGTRQSFEAKYGTPINTGHDKAPFPEYDVKGYGSVLVTYYDDRVTMISLFSDRPNDEDWSSDEPHELDWSIDKAHELALRFAPTDVMLADPSEEIRGIIYRNARSNALANDVPVETYEHVDNEPQPGGFQYVLHVTDAKDVSWIGLSLKVEEIPDANETVLTVTQQPTDPSATGFSVDEQTYVAMIVEQSGNVSASLVRTGQLFTTPRIDQDDWTLALVDELASWQQAYREAQEMVPPPAFADTHVRYEDALGLLSSAADDFMYGINNLDEDRIDQGATKMIEGATNLAEATRLVQELEEERGE